MRPFLFSLKKKNYTLVSITNPIRIYKTYNLVEVKIAEKKGYVCEDTTCHSRLSYANERRKDHNWQTTNKTKSSETQYFNVETLTGKTMGV